MIRRRRFIQTVAVGLLEGRAAAHAQAEKVYQVGYVSLGARPGQSPLWGAFVAAMRELNYVEGRNLIPRFALATGNPDRLPGLVGDLVKDKVDVIVTTSTQETRAAKRATSTIPIVMTLVPDPVGQGFVTSLARPGGNITGLTNLVPGLSQKYVELLREVVPSASRFAVVTVRGGPFPDIRRELLTAAQRFGGSVTFAEVDGPDDFEPALSRSKQEGDGGIIVPLDAVTFVHRQRLLPLVQKYRLPAIYWDRAYVEDGGLMMYGVSSAQVGRRAAYFVDRLFKRAKPADLPVEQPTKFELVINLKTAKALGLTIPPSLLQRADQVID
jgi:ABC-type uncharacterized transport system substrate-binding protein